MALITCPNPNCKRENIFDGGKCPGCGCTPATYAVDTARANRQDTVLKGNCPECGKKLNELKVSINTNNDPYFVSKELQCSGCGWTGVIQRNFRMKCSCDSNSVNWRNAFSWIDTEDGNNGKYAKYHCNVKWCNNSEKNRGVIYIYANDVLNGKKIDKVNVDYQSLIIK